MDTPTNRLSLSMFFIVQSVCFAAGSMLFDLGWALGLLAGVGTAFFRAYVLGQLFASLGRIHLASFRLHAGVPFTLLFAITEAALIVFSAWFFDHGWGASQGLDALALIVPMVIMVVSAIVIAMLCGPRATA